MSAYLFTTPRLGFRTWKEFDLDDFAAINADPEVMRFFQKPYTREDTQAMMERMQNMFEEKGYCYFAVDLLETKELIGAIGLGWKTFESDFTPCVDIGWRIGKKWWNKGLSSEGAKACLDFAKEKQIQEVLSMASTGNLASIQVMKKIGMSYWKDFDHPDLKNHPDIQRCSLYRIQF
ncbi:RimJ/RimL family protein N-acetyltransferase [Algoriphagus boseongensis]|uniref:RimJ/RimL family protein N-acetyltransferase n=1 Tax=Algoriphagus boseongensis TaxID=1442587 RepID=A0A4R6T5F4_9BACT|nr:GNAT family N-acetyltransferase [Algoriphagus boseongensis]TDQ18308.1 RimJ/RimL family protein N-acetyltransferase [Algoriphagus boseongensis]